MGYKIKINDKTKKDFSVVLTEYKKGVNYKQIAEKMDVSSNYIYSLVSAYKKHYGITSRVFSRYDIFNIDGTMDKIIEKYQNGESSVKIGKTFGISERTVIAYLRKRNIEIKKPGIESRIDQNIFDNIDSEIKAYTIGLIMSDGNVSKKGATVSITLTKNDGYILEKINEELLDSFGNLLLTHTEDKKPRMVLQFNGLQIKERLKDFGIVPNKSNCLTTILVSEIPEHLFPHYIRGLYDGDGICSFQTSRGKQKVRIGFCGKNEVFVKSYRDFLVEKICLNKNKIFNTGNCFQVSWSSNKNLKDFYDYIYKDATIYLGRKKKKLFDYVNTEVTQ